jgi:hypothetical protein
VSPPYTTLDNSSETDFIAAKLLESGFRKYKLSLLIFMVIRTLLVVAVWFSLTNLLAGSSDWFIWYLRSFFFALPIYLLLEGVSFLLKIREAQRAKHAASDRRRWLYE